MHRRTFDPTLQKLFWAGQLTWAAGFLVFWFPDKLACAAFQRYSLHAWFHVCVSIAPLLFLTHTVHCYYVSELAARTGRVSDAVGRLLPAPPEVIAYLAARDAREPPPAVAVDMRDAPAVPVLFWVPLVPVPFVRLTRARP